jgi:hypothetical protein
VLDGKINEKVYAKTYQENVVVHFIAISRLLHGRTEEDLKFLCYNRPQAEIRTELFWNVREICEFFHSYIRENETLHTSEVWTAARLVEGEM